MTQDELDALLAQIGGGRLAHAPAIETKKIPNPNRLDADGTIDYSKPKEIEVTIQRWHNPASGRVIEAYQGTNGWTIVRNSTDKSLVNVGASPETQAPRSAGEQRTAREEAEIARNADPAQTPVDPYPETDKERKERADRVIKEQGAAARQAQQDAQKAEADARAAAERNKPDAVSAPPTQPFIVDRLPDGTIRSTKNPNYTGDKPEAGKSITVKGGDGKTYVVPINPDGTPGQPRDLGIPAEPVRGQPTQIINDPNTGERSEIVRNPDGTVKEVRPLPGSKPTGPTTRAPSMPHIVVGEAQNALRTAYDQIQEEVDAGRRTPAWGENRRKEIFQTAQLTVQEANLVENSRQSNQSFAFNVANTKLQYGQGAFESAMRFTLSIIDKLEPGSGTGGKMFAAMLGLSMANRASSGIDDLEIPRGASVGPGRGLDARGSQAERRPPPAPPRLTDPGDPKAVDADLERAKAHPAFQATDTTDANGQPRVMTPSVGVGQGAPLPAAAPAPAPAAPVSTAPAPVVAPGSTPTAPAYVRTDVNGAPAPPQPAPGTETMTIRNKADGRLLEIPRARWPDFQGAYEEMPAPTLPSASPQAMTQPQVPQFAAVEAMMPAPQAPQMPAVDSSGGIQLPALDAAQIAATPPWRLPPDQLDNLVQQYGEQVVFGMPGMGVLA